MIYSLQDQLLEQEDTEAACGHIGKAVKEKFNVPVITSMNDENPGVEMFRKDIYIFKGGASAASHERKILRKWLTLERKY